MVSTTNNRVFTEGQPWAHLPARSGWNSILLRASKWFFLLGLALITIEQVRPFEVQVSDLFFAIASVAAGLYIVSLPKRKLPWAVLLPGWIIMFGCVISSFTAANVSFADVAKIFALWVVFPFTAALCADAPRAWISALTIGAGVNCVLAILQWAGFESLVGSLELNPVRETEIFWTGRDQGLSSTANLLAFCAAFGCVLAIGHWSAVRRRRWMYGLLFVVCFVGGLLTLSRTFVVMIVLAFAVLAFVQKLRWKYSLTIAIVGLVAAISLSSVADYEAIVDRLASSWESSSDVYRARSWAYGVEQIRAHPVLGYGASEFSHAGETNAPFTPVPIVAHNALIQYWYGFGILGALGFLMSFAVPAVLLLRAIRRSRSKSEVILLQYLLCAEVAMFAASNLHPFQYNRLMYVPIVLFGAYAGYVSQEELGGPSEFLAVQSAAM